ncbi:hypothetical protein EGW08_016968 [Elysia chlorotica]|uniref:HECT-type E3 ubiquitin transferase n=1 Tax=Elysia chlorotica TaxID=188477 RepID=A0A3S0ZBT3_ELYCH|nr:hypothetical protein EGW08_016968 [Elysia chlorotica]
MAKAQRVTSDYTSIDDLSLPRGSSLVSLREQNAGLERSSSDSDLNLISPQSWSRLSVDKTFFWLKGSGNDQSARVQVEWDIQDNVGAQDWIGLFHSGEEDTSKFLDCKTRGSSGGSTGTIFWDLDAVEHLFTEDKTVVCFKYISGTSGDVLASSPVISVILAKSEQASTSQESCVDGLEHAHFCLTLEDVHATNLKKGVFFNPDPYFKLQILPHNQKNQVQRHHHLELRSSVKTNTANPIWRNEKFSREVLLTDLLEIEVKHKFSKSRPTVSRFLGRCTLPVQTITERIRHEQKLVQFNLELMRKSPSDNVSGTLGFKANLHLLLEGVNIADANIKSNNNLHRQTSLPSSWSISTPRTSRTRARHTDPGEEARVALDSMCVGSDIEEAENSESFGAEGMDNSNSLLQGISVQQGLLQGNESLAGQPDSVENLVSLPSSSENSDNCNLPVEAISDSGAEKSDTCSYDNSSVSVIVTGDETESNHPPVSNGDVPSYQSSSNAFNKYGLDMTVQSGQLNCSNRDAPSLPPRTYKAPPLPPRVYKSQRSPPPPLPPRHNKEREKKKVVQPTSLDVFQDPPPLPPRTYSPIDINDSSDSGEGSGGAMISGRDSSREQELFPWGDPPQPQHSGLRGHSGTPSPHQISPTSLSGPPGYESASCLAIVPSSIGAQSGQASPQLPLRPGLDVNPGSRGSVAWSTTSDPPVTTSRLSESGHPKRRSVDDIGASNHPGQIRRRLEQWYIEKQKNSPTNSAQASEGQSSPVLSSQCISTDSSRNTPPPVPPSLSFAGASATARTPDSIDSPVVSPHSSVTSNAPQPQVPTSASNISLPSLPSVRDRSNDRRVQNSTDGNCGIRRPTKYHRVDDRDDALPTGWEARVDTHGRIFYIDHVNRTTTWLRPQTGHQTVQRRPTLSSEQRQQLDQRYQSIRRTINQSQPSEGESANSTEPREQTVARAAPEIQADTSTTLDGGAGRTSERSRHSVYKYPAVKFLTRPDFFPILQANEAAMVDYNRNSKLKHMITKMRRDPKAFERYQHNRDLVSFVNLFCDTTKELPHRWEMKYDRSGKAFFIDHVLRTTTFMDPRLPTDVPLINPEFLQTPAPRVRTSSRETNNAPVPPPRQPLSPDSSVNIPTAYNEKVVLFLQQPNIERLLRERCPQFSSSSSLREKVTKIASRGVDMLERFSNDIDLTILLSLFENEIMSYVPPSASSSRVNATTETAGQGSPQGTGVQRLPGRVPAPFKGDFHAKLRNFYRRLESKGYGAGPGRLSLTVRRDHVLEDAFNKIMATPKRELQKHRLNITFAGEEGLDYGGPSREFFFLLSRELFNPYYGLFEYSANDTYTVQVSPSSTFVENAHEWFRFSGRVLGLALVHQYLLDAFFTRPFYKALLRVPLSLEDVESLDTEFHQSLLWIKDNDISEVDLGLTFSVSEEVFGQVTERELKPNGKNINVTERNKKDYIEKMVKWRLERGVTEQTESLIRGFHEVLDSRQVSSFDARELELVIAGTVEIDIADWRRNTDYRSGLKRLKFLC